MVVAQLVERSLPTPEVCDSNPVIGTIYIERLLTTLLKRRKNRKEEAENGPFKNNISHQEIDQTFSPTFN